MQDFLKDVLKNLPSDWIRLTTHRLDIYNEELAKTQFLEELEVLYKNNDSTGASLNALPTAFDYIRLGHPLSCLLEWVIAKKQEVYADSVISFGSVSAPILAILRKNSLEGRTTRINYIGQLPEKLNLDVLKDIYDFQFELNEITNLN